MLSRAQVDQLLLPINGTRVLKDGKGHSHVSQQDILAHLVRVFGFGNFDIDVLNVECVFEHERTAGRFDVCYRALVRVAIRNEQGAYVCHYENGSTATAQNQSRGDAHDLAYKSAISLSVKRACIPLGDQFGLSLYNKGQTDALVRGTLVLPQPPGYGVDALTVRDMQDGVPQQVSLGNDEIHHETDSGADVAEGSTVPGSPAPRSKAAKPKPMINPDQSAKMFALFGEKGITDRDVRLAGISKLLGREVATTKDLTRHEASLVINSLMPPEGEQ